ncbi:pre-mRNA-splicing factor cwf19 [Hirsutella rhossiliensis]|uniref:Pre-mRNA-splicing factor cwf19 n=1 Tax=Hirsutella rhossiliensis TaxID=111463 RepID=A0A9P8N7N3_9HYPO|nr:pre-mRNA-splicing factor cwf19 [Hirsutella rhossiliensis]KAH0968492.1 pre-mRNA-splicing factor cwf19 [Hirsutella rhossiliensis]
MDGLDEFEKTLAAEKADRERQELRKHRHHHRRHHRQDRDDDDDDDGHRHKRSRRSRDDADDGHRRHHRLRHTHRHDKQSDPKQDLPCPDDEKPRTQDPVGQSKSSEPLVRDAWMTAPSALDVEHIHRSNRSKPKPPTDEPKRVIHHRELNHSLQALDDEAHPPLPSKRTVDYTFGDAGSSWRMTKLKTVHKTAEETGRSVEDVAVERYGSLEEYDDAQEEKAELARRCIYGTGYKEREKPTGELSRERQRKQPAEEQNPGSDHQPEQGAVIPDEMVVAPATDRTALNRLRAQTMKAKLRRAPDAAQLEQEYNRAAAAQASQPVAPEAVVLGVMESRQLAGPRGEVKAVTTRRGRERGAVEENDDMTIDDMVREERRTKGQAGGEGMRLAERIARDGRFADSLEYMDDNAARLARRVHKSEISLKNMAVAEVQRATRALDRCPLCHDEDAGHPPAAPVVALGTRVFLTLATQPEVSEGGAVIVPLAHRANLLECDDDEWEEVRNFMKSLTRMYHDQGRDVVFYENAAHPHRRPHAAMAAVPVPYDQGAVAPAFFREAMLAADEEWAQHPKVIDTLARARDGGLGRAAFRRSLAREMPYFHAWFALDGGLGHVVEDPRRWPRGDLFAREVLASVVGAEPDVARRQGRWVPGADSARVEAWRRGWRRFDWTRALVDEGGGS